MSTLVFDIETVGQPLESFDEITQAKILPTQREGESTEEYERRVADTVDGLVFSPFTGEIVAIACVEVETGWSGVYYQNPKKKEKKVTDAGEHYVATDEKGILQHFWALASKCDQFVTFNGRGFDVPYIMLRSAIHGIRPTKNLGKARYLYQMDANAVHIDLYDQLTFYRAFGGRFIGLHMACNAFGIPSPKEGGMDGSQVGNAFRAGHYRDIAKYCLADVVATAELYKRWDSFLRF